ncbi:MAG: hypothetical protein QM718_12830 [Steroidobacteraceae bacterium]
MHSAPGRHERLQRAVLGVLLALHLLLMPVCMSPVQAAAAASAAAQSEAPCPMHAATPAHAADTGTSLPDSAHHDSGGCHCLTAHCALLGEWRIRGAALSAVAAIPAELRTVPAFQPERELRPPIR